jgi:hypothetical protein
MKGSVRLTVVISIVVALVVLLALRVSQLSAAPPASTAPARGYYLTPGFYTGAQALTACATGYHMASLFEISSPSTLRYETSLGRTTADSGLGPPSYSQHTGETGNFGWARTGASAGVAQSSNDKNCNVWTSNSTSDWGTAAAFVTLTTLPWPTIETLQAECDWTVVGVWCIQN